MSFSPSNKKVIDTASRMAKVFNADFTALYIDTETNLSAANKLRLEENTAFAKVQGAKL